MRINRLIIAVLAAGMAGISGFAGLSGAALAFDPDATPLEAFREARLIRDAHAISIHHEMSYWPLPRQFENLKELRVHSRLAPRNLDDGRLAFVCNCPVQHALNLFQTAVCLPLRPAARITGRTPQVTVVRDLNEQRTTVLLVVRTDTTVVRASVAHRRIGCEHLLRRLDERFSG